MALSKLSAAVAHLHHDLLQLRPPIARTITAFVKLDPKAMELKQGFMRDVTEIGHYGTDDPEIVSDSAEDFEAAQ